MFGKKNIEILGCEVSLLNKPAISRLVSLVDGKIASMSQT